MVWCLVKHRDNFTFTIHTTDIYKVIDIAMLYCCYAKILQKVQYRNNRTKQNCAACHIKNLEMFFNKGVYPRNYDNIMKT